MEVPSVFSDFLSREEQCVPVGCNRDRNHKGDVPMTKSLLKYSVLLFACAALVFGVVISPAPAEDDPAAEETKQCSAAPAETCTKSAEDATAATCSADEKAEDAKTCSADKKGTCPGK